ncbi:hypothetical protein JCM24511_05815 [Saitozyma sp. JCM 24511]|nr:hypothetical protein JCM24511_05815 [Saitozyma sp. JCM 24511]
MGFVQHVTIRAKPGKASEILKILSNIRVEVAQKEPGTKQYHPAQNPEDENDIFIWEEPGPIPSPHSDPIRFNPILSQPSQSNPIQAKPVPIQANPTHSSSTRFNQHERVRFEASQPALRLLGGKMALARAEPSRAEPVL